MADIQLDLFNYNDLSDEPKPGTLLLVDGMALLFRAFFATSYTGSFMVNSKGIPTNAIYGFVRYFWDAIQRFQPSHIICCWDMGSSTFRMEKFVHYKANRGDPPLELIPQFDLVKEVVSSFGVQNAGLKGFEADDCIGTLARSFSSRSKILVLSGDHDMLQLVNDHISVVIMKKGFYNYTVYTPMLLLEEKGLIAAQIVDIKGLMGDTADNYPGVKGIGEKTALKLIQSYQTIEGILENLHLLPASLQLKITSELEMLHLSRDLARIRCDVPISYRLEDCCWTLNPEPVQRMFEQLEFKGLGSVFR